MVNGVTDSQSSELTSLTSLFAVRPSLSFTEPPVYAVVSAPAPSVGSGESLKIAPALMLLSSLELPQGDENGVDLYA